MIESLFSHKRHLSRHCPHSRQRHCADKACWVYVVVERRDCGERRQHNRLWCVLQAAAPSAHTDRREPHRHQEERERAALHDGECADARLLGCCMYAPLYVTLVLLPWISCTASVHKVYCLASNIDSSCSISPCSISPILSQNSDPSVMACSVQQERCLSLRGGTVRQHAHDVDSLCVLLQLETEVCQ